MLSENLRALRRRLAVFAGGSWQVSSEGVGWLLALLDAFIADAEALQSRAGGRAPGPGAHGLAALLAAKNPRPRPDSEGKNAKP